MLGVDNHASQQHPHFIDENHPKQLGSRHLSRLGYDEEKCRNVLVRYCAHIPRNYQYKDGVQQVFLILREHLGDENLDLAGGVLYEMIEIDCEHTDDPGAAFQRWRHDHMSRHDDLELPHVPHMTTITSSIIPTNRLARWRTKHPERYPFVLSDSSASTDRLSSECSCIRNRKAWLIDNTFYVSSRNGGTVPLNTPNPREYHEMHWAGQCGSMGRLVEEREILVASQERSSEPSSPRTVETQGTISSEGKSRESLSHSSILNKFITKFGKLKKKDDEQEQKRRSWLRSALLFETASLFKDWHVAPANTDIPLPDGCQVPNAIFARKYLLVNEGESLSHCLSIRQMPVAELKATDTIVEAAKSGLLDNEPIWHFRGPFTPQLGYDGGLDYKWTNPKRPVTTEKPSDSYHDSAEEARQKGGDGRASPSTFRRSQQAKRKAFQSGLDNAIKWFVDEPRRIQDTATSTCPRKVDETLLSNLVYSPHYPGFARKGEPTVPSQVKGKVASKATNINGLAGEEADDVPTIKTGHTPQQGDSSLFDNVEFVMRDCQMYEISPELNRKTTVVQRDSPSTSNSRAHHTCPRHKMSHLSSSNSASSLGSSVATDDDFIGCYECVQELKLVPPLDERPIVCEVRCPGPRLCGASQGVTLERLRSANKEYEKV